jgi:translation elongation factor EF-Tu-like GTPase
MSRRTIVARFRLLTTDAGGRSGPLVSGYRSLLRFEDRNADHGFELALDSNVGSDGIAPGSSAEGSFSFWAADELPQLFRGQKFEMREGTRVVGHGVVVEL